MTMLVMFSIKAFIEFTGISIEGNEFARMYLAPTQYLESGLFGLFFAIWFIIVNRLSERWRLERLGFGRTILAKSGIYLVGFAVIMFMVYQIINSLGYYPEEFLSLVAFGLDLKLMMGGVLFTMIALILLLNFILQSVKNMGHYNLESFLTGKYRKPVVEDRTFLFLDLKGSTSHAEKLGYMVYSHMIKDCMDDINVLLPKYKAEVYQYVGDEVILTWKTDDAVDNLNFIEIFYAFENLLKKRADHYKKKYDTFPVFKAGANSGRVTATEIGVINRDLAFHGDVLNTAARLQEQCNKLERPLLMSGQLKHQIGNIYSIPYNFESMGSHQLKGKHENVDVFAVYTLSCSPPY
jgi:adenylate cyclase